MLTDFQKPHPFDANGRHVAVREVARNEKGQTQNLSMFTDRSVLYEWGLKEALQKYPEQSFAQKFGLCNR